MPTCQQNRASDYIFSWEKNALAAMDGNTATYMQYAYVRTRGIFRKGEVDPASLRSNPPLPSLEKPEERNLALQLVRFQDALTTAAEEYKPNHITSYLWDLAKSYSGFFQNCSVLKAETPALRQSRLLLCDVTARVIQPRPRPFSAFGPRKDCKGNEPRAWKRSSSLTGPCGSSYRVIRQ